MATKKADKAEPTGEMPVVVSNLAAPTSQAEPMTAEEKAAKFNTRSVDMINADPAGVTYKGNRGR